jgi:hypothetical protein
MRDHQAAAKFDTGGKWFGRLLLAGIVGELVFELLAHTVGPLVNHVMRPGNLVTKLARNLLDLEIALPLGDAIHVATAVLLYPLGYVVFRRLLPLQSTFTGGLLWGVVLWLFAQGLITPLAGRPFMANFSYFLWVSLAVHALYAIAVAYAYDFLMKRSANKI